MEFDRNACLGPTWSAENFESLFDAWTICSYKISLLSLKICQPCGHFFFQCASFTFIHLWASSCLLKVMYSLANGNYSIHLQFVERAKTVVLCTCSLAIRDKRWNRSRTSPLASKDSLCTNATLIKQLGLKT